MKPNHSYLCITPWIVNDQEVFTREEFYDTDENGKLIDNFGEHTECPDESWFLDEDEVHYYLTPKGCLSCALEDLGISEFQLEDKKLNVCFFVLETRMKQNGFVIGEPNDGCKTTETPESIFKKTIPLFYDIDDNTVDAAWILFRDLIIKHQNGSN